MRTNKYLIFFILSIFVFFGCEETEFETTEENLDRFVAFETGSGAFAESSATTTADGITVKASNSFTFNVLRSSSDVSTDLTVSISASITFATDTDFANQGDDASSTVEISGDLNSFVIPAGAATESIVITSLDDEFSAGDKTISLTINSVSDASYSIGAQGIGGTAQITVVDDDCPIDLSSFAGEYTIVSALGTENSCCPDFEVCGGFVNCTGPVTLVADETDPLGQTAILKHPSFIGDWHIQFVTCPLEVIVVKPMDSFDGFAWFMQQGATIGNYNDDTKDINIAGILGTNGDWIVSLKKN